MNISIGGTGYVGLVTGACLAELGHNVICIDIDKKKIDMINGGKTPIYEEGLENLIKKNIGKRLRATGDWKEALEKSEVTFICVGTPAKQDGSTDLTYIESASRDIGKQLKNKAGFHVIVIKSTVPPKTCERVMEIIEKESGKKNGKEFGIASNPEFLREGNAVYDFMNPGRIVIGTGDDKTAAIMSKLYSNFKCQIVKTDLRTSEMIKYAGNAMLATKISFANEIGNVCKKLGIDVYDVMDAIGMDKRIGRSFLNAGLGYGGSCFKKDIQSLINTAKELDINPKLLLSTEDVNESQPLKIIELAKKKLGSLKGKKIAVLGLAFKPDSDDMREAPSIKIINQLLVEGGSIKVYDPAAMENAKKIFANRVEYASSLDGALAFGDIVFILTEWKEFKNERIYKGKTVFDGRKTLNRKSGENYEGVCW